MISNSAFTLDFSEKDDVALNEILDLFDNDEPAVLDKYSFRNYLHRNTSCLLYKYEAALPWNCQSYFAVARKDDDMIPKDYFLTVRDGDEVEDYPSLGFPSHGTVLAHYTSFDQLWEGAVEAVQYVKKNCSKHYKIYHELKD